MAHPVPFMAQRHLQPTGVVAAFVEAKDLDQHCFPGRCFQVPHRPLLLSLPDVKAAGRHVQYLAEPAHGVVAALCGDEAVAAHGSGVCEMTRLQRLLAMAFFKNIQFLRLPPVGGPQLPQFERRGRVQRRVQCGRNRRLGRFMPLAEAFGVDVERPGGGLGRAALRGQAQGFSAAGRVVFAAVIGFRSVFHDRGKMPPYSVQVYPTTSLLPALSA